LSAAVVRNEGEHEYSEGTATYVQARLFQLLMRKGGIEPVAKIRDPHYHGFAGATTGYRRYKAGVLPSRRRPISFFHSQYQHGMAQCLLLDRVRPEWKTEMRERGQTQFDLLQKEFPITDTERAALVESAKQRFGYGSLLATQRRLVGDRLARIKAYLHAKGRRYRVYHSAIPARFRWKPSGPVYTVPASLLGAEAERIVIERGGGTAAIRNPRVSIWAGGIQRFEKSGLLFESKAVPIIFRPDYMEWIDPDPDSDGDDFKIESKREVDGVRHDVKITTDGFTLRADRVRIETSDDGDIVTIRPVRG
ncbi:MAG: calponin homology domain-containing protein, partial [Planctomycetota bacterium]